MNRNPNLVNTGNSRTKKFPPRQKDTVVSELKTTQSCWFGGCELLYLVRPIHHIPSNIHRFATVVEIHGMILILTLVIGVNNFIGTEALHRN